MRLQQCYNRWIQQDVILVTLSDPPEVKASMLTLCGPAREPARAIGWLACLAGGALTRLPTSDTFRLLFFTDCTYALKPDAS